MGAQAAPAVTCHAVVLTSEPSACNGHGNVLSIIAALPQCEHSSIAEAVHVDGKSPTDPDRRSHLWSLHGSRRHKFGQARPRPCGGIYYAMLLILVLTVAGVLVPQFESK